MLAHQVSIKWNRDTEDCNKKTYNRDHEELHENGVTIPSKLINEISARQRGNTSGFQPGNRIAKKLKKVVKIKK